MSAKREKRRQILAEPSYQDDSDRQEDANESSYCWVGQQMNNSSSNSSASSSTYDFRPISSCSGDKTHSEILSNQRLLEANYLEATKACPVKKVIGKETQASKAKRTKCRQRKNELSSLLMILFGALLLTGWVSAPSAAELINGSQPTLFNNSTVEKDSPTVLASNLSDASDVGTTLAPKGAIVVANSTKLQSASLVVQASNKTFDRAIDPGNSANSKQALTGNDITTTFESRINLPPSTQQTTVAPDKVAKSSSSTTTTAKSTTTTRAAPTTIAPASSGEDRDGVGGHGGVESGANEPNDSDKNRLVSALLSTVGEAADQLVKRAEAASSEPREGEKSKEDESEEEEEKHGRSSDADEAPIERRDQRDEEGGKRDEKQQKQWNLAPIAAAASRSDSSGSNDKGAKANSASGSNRTEKIGADEREEQLKLALTTYATWRSAADDLIELFAKKLLPIVVEHGYDVDPVTVTGLLQVFNGIRAIKPWALKLLDASAKITPGLLHGTQSDFGDFDECLNVRADDPSGLVAGGSIPDKLDPETGLRQSTLIGRYCLADIEFPKAPRFKLAERNKQLQTDYAPIELRRPLLNFSETAGFKDTIFVETGNFLHMLYVDPIRVGICLTNKIDPDSLAKVANKLFEEFKVTINFRGRCVTKYDRPVWTVEQRVSAWVLVIACSLVVLSTLLEILQLKLHKLPLPSSLDKCKLNLQYSMLKHRPLLTSFSLIRNTKRLFEPSQSTALQSAPSNCNYQWHHPQHNQTPAAACQVPRLGLFSRNSPSLGSRAAHRGFISSALTDTNSSDSALSKSLVGSSTASCESSSESCESESSPTTERRAAPISSSQQANDNNECIDCSRPTRQLAHFQLQPQPQTTAMATTISQARTISAELMMISHANLGAENDSLRTTNEIGAATNLLCLHGIRVITMTWMIVNHTYLFGGFFVLWAHRRLIDIAEWPKSISFQLVLNGWLTVETYFFLSAAIIVMATIPLIKARKFSYCHYVAHRLVRLLPAYIGLVCLNFLWPLVSSGPVWLVKGRSFIQAPCENYLWANVLFVSNWLWPENQCMVHTWFLSADFQLYLLAPLVVYLLYRRPVLGHSLNILVAIVASIFSGFVIYANKLLPTTLINKLEFDSIKQQLSYSYFATYQHMGPYCLGIFIGYTLHKRPQVRLPKHLTWLLWLLLPPLSFTTLLLTYLWNGAYDDPDLINPSPLVSAFYVAIHRTIWTSLLAWIVFACATGRARLMSSFLSHHFFVPLSRLSFSIYLVHLPVILFRALNLRYTVEWTDSNILWEACGNFMASLAVGYFVNIAFESPIVNLERFFSGRDRATAASNTTRKSQLIKTTTTGGVHCLSSCHELQSRPVAEEELDVLKVANSNLKNLLGSQRPTLTLQEKPKTIVSEAELHVIASTSGNDDSSSGQSSSSPESERKLTTSCMDNKRDSAGRQQEFNTLECSEPTRRSSSLRPNLIGVGAAASTGPFAGESDEQMEPSTARTSSRGISSHQQNWKLSPDDSGIQRRLSNQRRYSVYSEALMADNDTRYRERDEQIESNARIYPISSEFQHYARAGFHLPRVNSAAALANASGRVSQYATLSRAGRFGDHQPHQTGHHQYPIASSRRGGGPRNSRQNSHSGESRESLAGWIQQAENEHQTSSRQRGLAIHSRSSMVNQHQLQGRYNTMSGPATRDWMREFSNFPSHSSPITSTSQPMAATNGGGWLQPGALIPRIDSSTLRRQTMRPELTNSIVEEREDSVSDDKVNL